MTTQERGGPGPGRRSRLLQDNTLNEILVFDLSLAIGLHALTNYAGTIMGVLRRMHQPKLNRRHATERRAPGWTGKLLPF